MQNRVRLFWLSYVLITAGAGVAVALRPSLTVVIVGLVGVGILLPYPRAFVVLAGLTLPWASVLAFPVPGLRIAAADVVAVTAIAAVLALRSARPTHDDVLLNSPGRALLRPVRTGIAGTAVYVVVGLLVTAATAAMSPTIASYGELLQRAEIVIIWMILGVLAARSKMLYALLAGFVVSCVVQSLLWMATPGVAGVAGVQKNPSGGFIASAVFIVLLSRLGNRTRIPLLLLLAGGLVATGSRGSILGLLAGLAVLMLFRREWKRLIGPLAGVCAVAGGALFVLPIEMLDRLLSRNADGRYTEQVREVFTQDALGQWDQFPGGIGVGNYQQQASALQNISTHDPHNVFVLQLVEGGYPLLIAFTLLVGGSIVWLYRQRSADVALLGLTVQVAILAHAWVDVYWVRGTPSLGWLMVGAAAGVAVATNYTGSESTGTSALQPESQSSRGAA